MFRVSTREKRMFLSTDTEVTSSSGSLMRIDGSWQPRCPVPVDVYDPDASRFDDRRERVLFRMPESELLQKYNVDQQ